MIHEGKGNVKRKFIVDGKKSLCYTNKVKRNRQVPVGGSAMKAIVKKFIRLVIGLAIMSFGSAMALQANMGMEPWDVLNHGVSVFLKDVTIGGVQVFTFGRANITIGFSILFIDLLFKEKVGFGTFINILICGNIIDLVTGALIPGFALLPDYTACATMTEHLVPRLLLCVFSVVPAAYGMYVYMSAKLGSGPRDGLMCVVTRRLPKVPVGAIRVVLEGMALIIGWLLGGTVGVGTIILVCSSGPVMQLIFKLAKFDVKELRNETIPETLAAIRAARTKSA